jgi:DNA-binding GntR family transcriptional regulator
VTTTLADQVYDSVRRQLLAGDVARDGFIREQDVTEATGASRTPVREALGRLASEGFLERIPHRGFRVPEESLSRLLDLYPIVAVLEVLAGRLAFPNLTPADHAALRGINDALRRATASADVIASVESNSRFHAFIAGRSGNDRLSPMLDDLRAQLRRLETWYYWRPEHGQQSVREHEELIDALEGGREDRALEILEGNMQLTRTALLKEIGRRGGGKPLL